MTVGTVLKQAREQAGLSAEQISERTKIQLYKIEALEEDDFSRLPEGIYLDGIIRAYSREVGINSEAMVARARIERGKRPGDWEVPFSAPIDLRGAPRPSDRHLIDVPDSGDQLGSFVTEHQTADDAPAAPHDPRIVEHSSWINQPIITPSLPERQDPVIARTPAVRPRHRRGRSVLALLVLFAAAFFGAYLYESNRAIDWIERAVPTARPATDVENATPKTESPSSADVTVRLRMQLRKTPRSLPPARNPVRPRNAPLMRAPRLPPRTSQPNLRARHRQHVRETSQQAGLCPT